MSQYSVRTLCFFNRNNYLKLDVYFDEMTEELLQQQETDSINSLVCK